MITGKTIALTRQTFVSKVMSLLFNMQSRLVITFLPRSKHLLISWLQSPSTVILEPKNIVGTRLIFVYWLNEWHVPALMVFRCPVVSIYATPWTAARQASLSLTTSRSLPKYMSVASVTPSSRLILWPLFFFCSQSFPASGIFPMSQLFTSGDQNTGALASASASVLPASIQG